MLVGLCRAVGVCIQAGAAAQELAAPWVLCGCAEAAGVVRVL